MQVTGIDGSGNTIKPQVTEVVKKVNDELEQVADYFKPSNLAGEIANKAGIEVSQQDKDIIDAIANPAAFSAEIGINTVKDKVLETADIVNNKAQDTVETLTEKIYDFIADPQAKIEDLKEHCSKYDLSDGVIEKIIEEAQVLKDKFSNEV